MGSLFKIKISQEEGKKRGGNVKKIAIDNKNA